jgi:hypothetical protein
MKTWKWELLIVGTILCLTTYFLQNTRINWLTTVAILLTFQHAQISDRLQEGQKIMKNPDVKCYWKLDKLFVAKELIWILTFFIIGNYAAIIGSILFAIYPVWRRLYRKRHSKKHPRIYVGYYDQYMLDKDPDPDMPKIISNGKSKQ